VGRLLQPKAKNQQRVQTQDDAHWERITASVISATRQDLDMTQEDLAEKLGWTRDAVSNIENGRRHVRVSNLIRIAKAFGMEPEALLERIVRW
jgi:transcriptional regulator with XRE-family HTH domain